MHEVALGLVNPDQEKESEAPTDVDDELQLGI